MIAVGERGPGRPRLADAARRGRSSSELAEGTPYLLLFYLFDWSST